jgi:hypothetical protein
MGPEHAQACAAISVLSFSSLTPRWVETGILSNRHNMAAAKACGRQSERNGATRAARNMAQRTSRVRVTCFALLIGTYATAPIDTPSNGARRRNGTRRRAAATKPSKHHARNSKALSLTGIDRKPATILNTREGAEIGAVNIARWYSYSASMTICRNALGTCHLKTVPAICHRYDRH